MRFRTPQQHHQHTHTPLPMNELQWFCYDNVWMQTQVLIDIKIGDVNTPYWMNLSPRLNKCHSAATSCKGNTLCIAGPVSGESTEHQYIPLSRGHKCRVMMFSFLLVWTAMKYSQGSVECLSCGKKENCTHFHMFNSLCCREFAFYWIMPFTGYPTALWCKLKCQCLQGNKPHIGNHWVQREHIH